MRQALSVAAGGRGTGHHLPVECGPELRIDVALQEQAQRHEVQPNGLDLLRFVRAWVLGGYASTTTWWNPVRSDEEPSAASTSPTPASSQGCSSCTGGQVR